MTVSFFHGNDEKTASYRYRGAIPASVIGATMNDESADVWVLSKIRREAVALMDKAKALGKLFIVDVCDPYIARDYYRTLITGADAVTCSTEYTAMLLKEDLEIDATVIPDPYEFWEAEPHVTDEGKMLWFGHAQNFYGLDMHLPYLDRSNLHIMSNIDGMIPWSIEGLSKELQRADIVLLPETAPYKSANRAVEAIRQGCFVVADPHPSLENIPGIWQGNILEGIEWCKQHPKEANQRISVSQAFIATWFSPETVGNAWRTCIQARWSTWDAGISRGLAGSMSMPASAASMPMLSPI
jgi:hypothetical protein